MLGCRRYVAQLLVPMDLPRAEEAGEDSADPLKPDGPIAFSPDSVFLLQVDGSADPFYQIGVIRLAARIGGAEVPSPVPVILIARVQGKLLVAIPHQFWHRQVALRKLRGQSFSKPSAVSVSAVLDSDREVLVEEASIIECG